MTITNCTCIWQSPAAFRIFSHLRGSDLHSLNQTAKEVSDRIKLFAGKISLKEVVGNSFDDAVLFVKANRLTNINLEGYRFIRAIEIFALIRCIEWEINELTLSSNGIGNEALRILGANAPNLSGITLTGNLEELDNDGFAAFTAKCRGLKKINLFYTPRLDSTSLVTIPQNCPLLEELSLYNLPLSNAFFQSLTDHCLNLKRLSVSCCKFENVDYLCNLVARRPNLEKLNIAYTDTPAQNLLYMIDALNHPKKIVFSGCEVDLNVISRMALAFPQLKCLSLMQCANVDDETINLATLAWPNLEQVHLQYTNVTDEGVLRLAERCPGLKKVDFSSLSDLTDHSVVAFLHSHPHLESLEIKDISNITNVTALAIAQTCHQLKYFNSINTRLITPDHIGLIAENCPMLESLGVHCLTNDAADKIAANCPNLEVLFVANSRGLQIGSICNILDSCPKLERVVLWGTPPGLIDTSLYPQVNLLFNERSHFRD